MFGRSIQLCKDIEQKYTQIQRLCISAHQYKAELDRELAEQENNLIALESVQEAFWAQHKKIKVKKAQFTQNKTALLAHVTTGSTAHPSTTQKVLSFFAATLLSQVAKNNNADQEMATEEHESKLQVTKLLGW